MESKGKLNKEDAQAETKEEKNIKQAGVQLTDEELDKVAGGMKIVVIRSPDFTGPGFPS